MGYKVLQQQTEDPTTSFATQIAGLTNTIIDIRDVYDLGGAEVTIPSGCTLKFNGGRIKNGTVKTASGTKITIDAPVGNKIFEEISLTAALANDEIYLSWFCEVGEGIDNSAAIQSAFNASTGTVIVDGVYHISSPVNAPSKIIKGGGDLAGYKKFGFRANKDFDGITTTTTRRISGVNTTVTLTPKGMFYHYYDQHPIFKELFISAKDNENTTGDNIGTKNADCCIESVSGFYEDSNQQQKHLAAYTSADLYDVNIYDALVAGILQYGCEKPNFDHVYIKGCYFGLYCSTRTLVSNHELEFGLTESDGQYNEGQANLVTMTNVTTVNCNYGIVLYNNYNTLMSSCEGAYNYITGLYAENSFITMDNYYSEGDGMCHGYIGRDGVFIEIQPSGGSVLYTTPTELIENNLDGFRVDNCKYTFDPNSQDSPNLTGTNYLRSPIVAKSARMEVSTMITSNYPRGSYYNTSIINSVSPFNVRTVCGVDCIVLAIGSSNIHIGTHKVYVGSGNNPNSKNFFANYLLCSISNLSTPMVICDNYTRGIGVYYVNFGNVGLLPYHVDGNSWLSYYDGKYYKSLIEENLLPLDSNAELKESYNGFALYKLPNNGLSTSNNNIIMLDAAKTAQIIGTKKHLALRFVAHVLENLAEKAPLGIEVQYYNDGTFVRHGGNTTGSTSASAGYFDIVLPFATEFADNQGITFNKIYIIQKLPKANDKVYASRLYLYDIGDKAYTQPLPYIEKIPTMHPIDTSAFGEDYESSNAATSIEDGKPYIGVLSAADGGSKPAGFLDDAKVIMGGVDITNFAYDKENHTVYIPAVSGNVVINVPNYLSFKALDKDAVIKTALSAGTPPSLTGIEITTDGANWTSYTAGNDIDVAAGDTVYLRGNLTAWSTDNNNANKFTFANKTTGNDTRIEAGGDVTSLFNGYGGDYDLATNNIKMCKMFISASKLIKAPNLPSTKLNTSCYQTMFKGTKITETPILPATILDSPAQLGCYSAMFSECDLLNKVTVFVNTIPSSIDFTGFGTNWLNSVAATGDFYCDESMEFADGASGIPSGWTRYNLDGTPWIDPNA